MIIVLGSDLEQTGKFMTSDERINKLQENIFRSQQRKYAFYSNRLSTARKSRMDYVERQASTSFPISIQSLSEEAAGRQKYLWNTEFLFGDWLIPSITGNGLGNPMESALKTKEYVGTAMYAYSMKLMAER